MGSVRRKGCTLAELMIILAIVAILTAVSAGSFYSFVETAKKAEYYQKARLIRQALLLYEIEDTGGEGWNPEDEQEIKSLYKAMIMPGSEGSAIYPYVSESVKDCIWFDLRLKKENGKYMIAGFSYETENYIIIWKDPNRIIVKEKESEL